MMRIKKLNMTRSSGLDMLGSKLRRTVPLMLAAGLPCLATSCDQVSKSKSSQPSVASENEPVGKEAEQLHCNGIVDVDGGVVTLMATKSSTIEKLMVKEGDVVTTGSTVMRFASTTEQFAVNRAELSLKAAQNALEFAQAASELHKLQVQQGEMQIAAAESHVNGIKMREKATKELVDLNQASKIELMTVKSQIEEAEKTLQVEKTKLEILKKSGPEAKIAEAEHQIAAAQAAVEEAKFAFQLLDLKMPRSGTVLRLEVAEGSQVAAGQPVAIVAPDSNYVIRTQLDSDFAALTQVGQRAKIVPDTGNTDSRTWQGTIVSKSPWFSQRRSIGLEPRMPSESRTAECVIALDKEEGAARPSIGMKVRVVIDLATK